MTFSIVDHQNSNRVRVIKLKESDLDRLVFPFKKHSILSLEYKPFSRFSLAKSLDEVFENKLSKALIEILNDRKTGTAIIEPEIDNKKFNKVTNDLSQRNESEAVDYKGSHPIDNLNKLLHVRRGPFEFFDKNVLICQSYKGKFVGVYFKIACILRSEHHF